MRRRVGGVGVFRYSLGPPVLPSLLMHVLRMAGGAPILGFSGDGGGELVAGCGFGVSTHLLQTDEATPAVCFSSIVVPLFLFLFFDLRSSGVLCFGGMFVPLSSSFLVKHSGGRCFILRFVVSESHVGDDIS